MAVQFKLNMATLVEIANAANAKICVPAANKVAAAARSPHHPELAEFIHVKVDPRSGAGDWAHARVVNGHPHALKIESKHGVLARALGEA